MMKPVDSTVRAGKSGGAITIETVADILERETRPLIEAWLVRVEKEPDLASIPAEP